MWLNCGSCLQTSQSPHVGVAVKERYTAWTVSFVVGMSRRRGLSRLDRHFLGFGVTGLEPLFAEKKFRLPSGWRTMIAHPLGAIMGSELESLEVGRRDPSKVEE